MNTNDFFDWFDFDIRYYGNLMFADAAEMQHSHSHACGQHSHSHGNTYPETNMAASPYPGLVSPPHNQGRGMFGWLVQKTKVITVFNRPNFLNVFHE